MRSVIVTGGSRGLGLATARRLGCAGYRVIALARNDTAALGAARTAAAAAGGDIVFRAADLAAPDRIPSLIRGLRHEFGVPYALINNAGIGTGGVLGLLPDRDIEHVLRLNTLAPMLLTKYVARSMMTVRSGRIVNLSSVTATTGYSGLSAYSASKAALEGFTRSLARELGPLGITVNAIAPGFIDTAMTQSIGAAALERVQHRSALRRLAEPEDVARSIEFLLGEGGRNITGTVLTVDAGSSA